jgi:hypothetical protein
MAKSDMILMWIVVVNGQVEAQVRGRLARSRPAVGQTPFRVNSLGRPALAHYPLWSPNKSALDKISDMQLSWTDLLGFNMHCMFQHRLRQV